MKKNLNVIKLILESLEKEVLKEEGYDSQEDKNVDEYLKNNPEAKMSVKEEFNFAIETLCRKYLSKGLTKTEMMVVLSNAVADTKAHYN